MRNEVYPATNDMTTPDCVVTIKGQPVDATSATVDSEIPASLPAQVSGVGGLTGATGDVKIQLGADVVSAVPTPWSGSTPAPGDGVTVRVGRDGVTSKVFQGIVEEVGGTAADGVSSFSVIDDVRRLDKPINMRPLCAVMPAPTGDGTTNQMNIDLMSTYFVDRVLRHCGYYATPPRINYSVVSAPLQGSMWPEIGTLRAANREATIENSPWWRTAPWGVALKSAYADYRPNLSLYSAIDGSLSSRSLEIVLCAGPTQGNSGRVTCEWDTGAKLAMSITSSRSVIAQLEYPSGGAGLSSVLTATTGEIGDWRVITVRFEPRGDGTMGITMKADTGVVIGPRAATIPYGVDTRPLTNVSLRFTDSTVGGIQVGFPGTRYEACNHVPTAILSAPATFTSLMGSPVISERPVIELLKEWSEAECAAMWIDSDGVFRWVNRNEFVSGSIAWSGNSLDHLLDYSWSHSADGVRSSVNVEYKDVAVQRSNKYRLVVWQGSGQTMEPGDIMEDIVTASNDEAWINVATGLEIFEAETSKNQFNKGVGSWAGFVAYDKDGNEAGNGKYVGYSASLEAIATDTWKLIQKWTGAKPTGVDHIKLQTRDWGAALKSQWQGFDLPALRAQCKLTFEDVTRTASISGAPYWAPDLKHDASWWVQTGSQAQALAYWLAQQVTKPLPVVDGIEIVPDSRLQLGDKIRVSDTHRTGITIVGVITAITHRVENAKHTMVLRLLVVQVTANAPTLAEYDTAFSGAMLSTRDETWGDSTLAQFDANPLKR